MVSKVTIKEQQITLGKQFKESIESNIAKMKTYFDEAIEVEVNVHKIRGRYEIKIKSVVHGKFTKVKATGTDFHDTLLGAVDKFRRKIKRLHKYLSHREFVDHKKSKCSEIAASYRAMEEVEPEYVIDKRKQVGLKPMSEEEALLQMDMLGESFYVFLKEDESDDIRVAVVYKRKNGNYGIIEE